jgi:hypothetical protein
MNILSYVNFTKFEQKIFTDGSHRKEADNTLILTKP